MISAHNSISSEPRPEIYPLLAKQVVMIPVSGSVTMDDIRENESLKGRKIIACDFHIEGIEKGQELPYGYSKDNVITIDHHAPTSRMMRHISSTNLAIDFVNKHGAVTEETAVVINHCDCDSVLATLVLTGIIPPDEKIFGKAAIAADHTGELNDIADLLQALESKRDLNFSTRNLLRLLNKQEIEPEAAELLQNTEERRRQVTRAAENGSFKPKEGGLLWAVLTEKLDSCLLPACLPKEAKLIMTANPDPKNQDLWQVRLRLGPSAPENFSLFDLQINEYDSSFGGRWNAGSNARGGGTTKIPAEYAEEVSKRLRKALAR